jgi:hypothetical protein
MNQQQLLKLEAASLDPEFLKREPFARLLATIRKTQLPLKAIDPFQPVAHLKICHSTGSLGRIRPAKYA